MNPSAARQRLELVLKSYPRTLVIPETLYLLADVNFYEGKTAEALDLLRRLSSEYGYTEWGRDRKSTRLNSSHQIISYAVFCLKKKKKNTHKHNIKLHE